MKNHILIIVSLFNCLIFSAELEAMHSSSSSLQPALASCTSEDYFISDGKLTEQAILQYRNNAIALIPVKYKNRSIKNSVLSISAEEIADLQNKDIKTLIENNRYLEVAQKIVLHNSTEENLADVNKKLRLEFDSNRMKQYKNAQALEDMQKQKLEYDDAILSDYKGRYAGYKYTNNDKIFSSNYDKDLSAHTTKNYGMDKFAFNAALNLAKDLSEEIKADKEAIDRDQAAVQADKNKFDSFVRSPRFQKSGFALPSGKTQESPVAQIVDAEYSYDENGNNIGVEKGGYRNSKGEIQEID